MIYSGKVISVLKITGRVMDIDIRGLMMEVNFFLPGLRRNYPLNVTVIRLLKEHPEFSGKV